MRHLATASSAVWRENIPELSVKQRKQNPLHAIGAKAEILFWQSGKTLDRWTDIIFYEREMRNGGNHNNSKMQDMRIADDAHVASVLACLLLLQV